MKMIFKIAKTELRNLFYSPVAWFLVIAFLVQCALFYSIPLAKIATYQDLMIRNSPKFTDTGIAITKFIFLSGDGVFLNVLQNLYLFVPLLTMGLISREINNGSIKLLYSSPVRTREIVLGKYLAILIYNLLLVAIVAIFIVSGLINIRNPDQGMLLSSLLGFYLLISAFAAIGMFMSSLTTYQIVSAIATFLLIFVIERIGGLWQKYDFIRDLTYFLSMRGRTAKMLNGLITSKDVIYFLVIIYMFLGFTLLKLKGGREFKAWYLKAFRYLAVIASALLIGYVTSQPGLTGYWDTTWDNRNTLHEKTQAVIADMEKDETLEVTLYVNLLGKGLTQGLPEARNAYLNGLWEPFLRFKPDIRFKYEYYYDVPPDSLVCKTFPGKTVREISVEIAKAMGADISRFKTPEEMRAIIDLAPEAHRLVMQLKYKGKTTFLRTFDDSGFWPAETQISAALKRLLQTKMPKILFATGNLERNIHKSGEREYNSHSTAKYERNSLINNGFDVDTISLETTDIPANISSLVIADPKTELSPTVLEKIQQYKDAGGNLLIFGEPGKQHILNPVLQDMGLQFSYGTLVQLSANEMPHMITPYFTPSSNEMIDADDFFSRRGRFLEDSLKLYTPGAAEVATTGNSPFTITTLLRTLPKKQIWNKAGHLVTDSLPPVFSAQEGDIKKDSFAISLALSRTIAGREQRIIVCGDADFMSNMRIIGYPSVATGLYSWLDYGRFPIYTPRPEARDTMLNISPAGANTLRIIYVWVLPALVLLLSIILLIRRKRK